MNQNNLTPTDIRWLHMDLPHAIGYGRRNPMVWSGQKPHVFRKSGDWWIRTRLRFDGPYRSVASMRG